MSLIIQHGVIITAALNTCCQHHLILSKHSFCLIYDVSYDFFSFILHSSDRTGKIPAWRSARLMSCWLTSQSEIFSFSSLWFPLKLPNQRTQGHEQPPAVCRVVWISGDWNIFTTFYWHLNELYKYSLNTNATLWQPQCLFIIITCFTLFGCPY